MRNLLSDHQRVVNATMVVAVATVLARTVLLAVAEPWPWMSETGDLLYDASLAFATAWLFQWLVIIRPERAERDRFLAVLAPKIDNLIAQGDGLKRDLAKATQSRTNHPLIDPAQPINGHHLHKLLAEISPNDPAPPFARWSDSLEHICRNAAEIRTSMTPLYPRLDPELLETLLTEEFQGQRMMEMQRLLTQINQMNQTHLGELHHSMAPWLASLERLHQLRSTTIRSSQPASTP